MAEEGWSRRRGAGTDETAFGRRLAGVLSETRSDDADATGTWTVDDGEDEWVVAVSRHAGRSTTSIPDGEDPAVTVVGAVADREGVDPLDLPVLYDVVGSEAISALLDADPGSGAHLQFEYCGYTVTVDAEGTVSVDG